MASCSVWVTPTNYLIFTTHKRPDGLGVIAPPFFKHDVDCPPSTVGSAIIDSLRASQSGFDDSNRNPNAILEFSGYRSWRAFERDSINLLVSLEGDEEVTITPTDPVPKGGFLYKPDEARYCRMDAKQIGATLVEIVQKKRDR